MLEEREIYELGFDKLWWVRGDIGGLGNPYDGPMGDWMADHKQWLGACKKFDVVVQAGGLCGLYPLLYKRYFTAVYTFEPSPWNFNALARNCWDPKIIKMNCALSNINQSLSVFDATYDNAGMHRMDFANPGLIPSITIDQLALTACDLIHLDIEGAEERALVGGMETIKKYKPTIILEHKRGVSIIEPLGYKLTYEGVMDSVYVFEDNL